MSGFPVDPLCLFYPVLGFVPRGTALEGSECVFFFLCQSSRPPTNNCPPRRGGARRLQGSLMLLLCEFAMGLGTIHVPFESIGLLRCVGVAVVQFSSESGCRSH
ncbi:hypothetical protein TcG_06034 [Trypanosoma cruzi]|nr:hypothetical protein TcG_06034 [Trypanosoma cruzi]